MPVQLQCSTLSDASTSVVSSCIGAFPRLCPKSLCMQQSCHFIRTESYFLEILVLQVRNAGS